MSTTRTYMPLTIAMRQEMAASDALATYDDYQARLVEISNNLEALLAVPFEERDERNDRDRRMLREDRHAIYRHINNLYTAHAVRVALRDGHALEQAGAPKPCPSTDHDGAEVPADRRIEAIRADDHLTASRCAYCAEGLAARLVRDGYHVTIHATHVEPTDGECS